MPFDTRLVWIHLGEDLGQLMDLRKREYVPQPQVTLAGIPLVLDVLAFGW